jgi:hypothetical protein
VATQAPPEELLILALTYNPCMVEIVFDPEAFVPEYDALT